jgi:hypothetical protein
MQHVVPLLDAFEASRDSRARRLCWLKIHPHVARMSRRQIRTACKSLKMLGTDLYKVRHENARSKRLSPLYFNIIASACAAKIGGSAIR